MSDYFGYKRSTQSDALVSADNAVIDLGSGRVGLVQGFEYNYAHEVDFRFEMGSSTAYFVNGKPRGSFSVSKLVGREGFLQNFGSASGGSDACGGLRTIDVSLDGESCQVTGGKGLNFGGCKLQSVGGRGSSGAFEIAETATFLVAELR